jgi:TP901 family phage tail tape measure protein
MASLFSVFARVHLDTSAVEKEAQQSGTKSGKAYADGFYKDSSGRLRQANGRFATDAQKAALTSGSGAGTKFGNEFGNKAGKGMTSKFKDQLKGLAGFSAAAFVPLGIAGAVAAIGKIGIQYENNLNIFKAVSKATGEQMAQVAAKARELGADVKLPGVSAAGAAEAMTELAKSGLNVQQSMDAARGALQLARAASISEAQAAEITGNAINAFGLQAQDSTFLVDELAAAANSSSVEVQDVSNAFKMAAAVFSSFQSPTVGAKESVTELNTAIAILGNAGIKGSDAGTSLKQALLQLTGPSMQAKDQMALLAQRAAGANISLEEQNDVLRGSKSVREKALAAIAKHNRGLQDTGDIAFTSAGKMRALPEIIDLVTRGTKGMTDEEKDYAITQIFGADASRAVIALMKGGLPAYNKMRTAIMQQGAAAQVSAAKNAGMGGAIDNVKSQIENASIAVYNAVKGPITTALNAIAAALPGIFATIGGFFSFLGQHIGLIRDLAIEVGIMVAAFKTYQLTLLAVTAATKAYAAVQTLIAFVQLAAQVRNFAGAMALLNATFLANPVGIVVVAIAALVGGLILAYKHVGWFRAAVDGAWKGIKIAISATVGWITGTVWPALKTAWDAIAAAAMWLWHNVFEPVWKGILAAVRFAIAFITAEINIGKAIFNGIATVVSWLYNNIFKPVWSAIATAVHNAWTIIQVVFAIMKIGVSALFAWYKAAWDNVLHPVFNAIVSVVKWVWNNGIKPQFELIKAAWTAVAGWFTGIYNSKVKPLFNTLSLYIAAIIIVLKAKFELVKAAWTTVWSAISTFYTTNIKPIFTKLIGFLQDYVVKGFTNTVNNIKSAWAKVQDAAKKPVTFVVNSVINPLIRGFNKIAGAVGVKDRIAEIGGFAAGGRIPGAPSAVDNRLAQGPGGLLKVASGEYIVNARDTAKALPLLKWVNAGMKGGPGKAAEYLGRKVTDYPGDGSEGWAFSHGGRIPGYADGGLVGWVKNLGKDVWGALSNPTSLIKAPLEAALSKIPGSGMIRNFLVGTGKKLINGLTGFASKIVGGGGSTPVGGRVGAAASFIKAQDGKPYVWASAGPNGYDCSGIVSAAYNILKGRNPNQHTFSTANAESYFNQHSLSGPLIAGWSHPGQSPASASVGHMAGQIAGMPFESRGSRGVIVGSGARRVGQFAQRGAAGLAHGGLVGNRQVQLMDQGGAWPTGTVRANMSGHTEQVLTGGPGGDINTLADLLTAILDSIRALGPEVAAALERPTRRAVQLGRSRGAAT